MIEDEKLEVSIDVPFGVKAKAILAELAREKGMTMAGLLRWLGMVYIREHMKVKEDVK
jgi:hypothetical protein